MLTLLTATGARPEAWAICERLMARQTYAGSVRWVIVDDGPEPQPVTLKRAGWDIEVIRPVPFWEPGQNTQARNLAAGMAVIPDDARLVVWEDDDYYGPGYLADVNKWLKPNRWLVGEMRARYYNVATRRGQQLCNERHASLCSTAMQGEGVKAFRHVLQSAEKFIDMQLWRQCPGRLFSTRHVVGIKGMPGRGGIGCGHGDDFGRPMKLSDWIGEDAALYGQ
jgi:hypothetical protein